MYNLSTGRLRHIVYVKSIDLTDVDENNEPTGAMTTVFTARANCQIKSGQQLAQMSTTITEDIITVLMRYDSRLTDDMYIVWNDEVYAVQNRAPDEREFGMLVTAKREAK